MARPSAVNRPDIIRIVFDKLKIGIMKQNESEHVFPNDVSYFFNISTLDSLSINKGSMNEPVRQPHAQIICITRGSGYFSVDLEIFQLTDNAIYTIPPGRFHQFRATDVVTGYVISFNADFLSLAIDGSGRPFCKEVVAELNRANMFSLESDSPALQSLLADITREFETHLKLRLEILCGLFKIFLMYMKRLATTIQQEEASSRKMRLFNSFFSKLDKEFMTKKQVAAYANELSVSPTYLTAVVKKVSGYSASYHIQQRMVQEAKRLAVYSDANMKMVAYALGFDDLSHFSKFFKNAAGVNFSEYKKSSLVHSV
jgi:AraC family transcriptional regulator, transcriptional activator of pobA